MRALVKMVSALALVAALGGCGALTSEQGFLGSAKCVADSRCDPFPDTSHHPVTEWTSAQPTS